MGENQCVKELSKKKIKHNKPNMSTQCKTDGKEM